MEDKINDFVWEVLRFTAKEDIDVFWRTEGENAPITFFVNTNDILYWGCVDAEELTPESLPVLKQAIEDLEKIEEHAGRIYGEELFCCRMAKTRPQGACYPKDEKFWAIFDECGEEREEGFGNPHPHPSKHKKGEVENGGSLGIQKDEGGSNS